MAVDLIYGILQFINTGTLQLLDRDVILSNVYFSITMLFTIAVYIFVLMGWAIQIVLILYYVECRYSHYSFFLMF